MVKTGLLPRKDFSAREIIRESENTSLKGCAAYSAAYSYAKIPLSPHKNRSK